MNGIQFVSSSRMLLYVFFFLHARNVSQETILIQQETVLLFN